MMIIAAGFYIMPCLPHTEEQMKRNMVIAECRSYCELTVNGKAVLYMDAWHEGGVPENMTVSKDSIPYCYRYAAGQWIYRYRWLPICNGTAVTADMCGNGRKRVDAFNKDAGRMIVKGIEILEQKHKRLAKELEELDYFLSIHNVQDDGYDAIARHANKLRSMQDMEERAMRVLKGIDCKQKVRMRLVCRYTLLYTGDGARNKRTECRILRTDSAGGMCVIQTADGKTPAGAYPLFAGNRMMNGSFSTTSKSAASFFDSKGRFTGHATVLEGDSMMYNVMYAKGRKQGYGIAENIKTGSRTAGIWNADTIVSGVRKSAGTLYNGQFNRNMQPDGHGISCSDLSGYYDGKWTGGKRNGFGCAVDTAGNVRVGEWKAGTYKGERLKYTPERIYGIDISRHQHEKGKKKYAINWNAIRITHLGKISNKNISGTVDYPVSFVYIKSTEGISVRNKYYKTDYAQARKRGMKCGSYHFFSPNSDAAKQAVFFLKNSRFMKGDFPPVLDVEPTESQIKKMGGPHAMFRKIRTWLNIVHNRTGVRPILYVNQQFVNKYLPLAPDIMSCYRVWIARYGEYKPDVRLVFWQLSPDGRVAGIHGDVDINVFNGYQDQYEKFVRSFE